MNEIFDSLMGGADYFAAACFHDALFDKVCFGQKNKNQIGRLSVAFSLFFDSFALRECCRSLFLLFQHMVFWR